MKNFIKLLSAFSIMLFLVSCGVSVNEVKPVVIQNFKTVITFKNDVAVKLLPEGDQEITIGDDTVTVKQETISKIKDLIEMDAQIKEGLVDLAGEQVTDENIAKIAHFAEKNNLDPKVFLSTLLKEE